MKPRYASKRTNVILVQDRVSHTTKDSLRPALRCRRITPFSVGIRPIPERATIINFGGGDLPIRAPQSAWVLNPPNRVKVSANKLETFKLLAEANVPTVRWTVDRDKAAEWVHKGKQVLARLHLSSSGGRGIRVVTREDGLPDAPLFTRYFPKTHEFRVHVVGGKAIDLVEKKLRDNLRENREDRSIIRNHRNGWVFAHDNLSLTMGADVDHVRQLGINATQALGLDFAAVDILAALGPPDPITGLRPLKKAVVCEVNSAPGIENTVTRNAYVHALNEIIARGH